MRLGRLITCTPRHHRVPETGDTGRSAAGTGEAPEQTLRQYWEATEERLGIQPPVLVQPAPEPQAMWDEQPPQFFQAAFLLLVHDYSSELVEVSLTAPCNEDAALEQVESARSEERHRIFPVLRAVQPQAAPGLGVLIALPPWPTQGVLIVCDTSRVDQRCLFTMLVSERMDYASLCAIAAVDQSPDVLIYVGDLPWPLSPGQDIQLFPGELVLFAPIDHPMLVVMSLQDMLLTSEGWLTGPDIPGNVARRLWFCRRLNPLDM